MKFKIKRFGYMMTVIIVLVMSQMSMALAATTSKGVAIMGSGQASITISGNQGQTLAGKVWNLHRLLDAENSLDGESIEYKVNEQYKSSLQKVVAKKLSPVKSASEVTEYEIIDYIQSLNKHKTEGAQATQEVESRTSAYRYFVEDLIEQLNTDGVTGENVQIKDTTANNTVVLSGLPYGYYLIEDVTNANGKNMAVSLGIVTTANPKAVVNIKSDIPTVKKKVLEDDGTAGWNDNGDYSIGQEVPFKFESVIPNINGYSKYYYSWHDKMDEALTLDNSSVKLTILGSANGTTKKYTLNSSEFSLVTESVKNATFQIVVSDIKEIIDREFPKSSTESENKYGQKVTVTYNAYLNEKAMQKTGQSGMENDVRIEFSNDPTASGQGKTGFTPWDTVVCFTYRLDGLKINNYGKFLGNAKFRLYNDAACTDEIYIKKVTDGYCVIHDDSEAMQLNANQVAITSNNLGEFVLYGLDSGTYYMKEVEAPEGYRPLLNPIEININPIYPTMNLSANAKITTFNEGKETVIEKSLDTSSEDGSVAISIVNQVQSKLPVTGSYMMPFLFVIGGLCMYASRKMKKKSYE